MFRRLLLILIFALVVPTAVAMPACAADPVEAKATHSDSHPAAPRKQERTKPGDQRCLGCVAPSMLDPPMIEAPTPALLLIPAAFLVTDAAFDDIPPALRPPRHG
jgi:hypothetical protein